MVQLFKRNPCRCRRVEYATCGGAVGRAHRARTSDIEVSRMKRLPVVLLLVVSITGSLAQLAAADLNGDVRAALKDKALAKGECGVDIIKLEGANEAKFETIFRHNSDIPLIPASNLKLITT